jgi:hypothetical protein
MRMLKIIEQRLADEVLARIFPVLIRRGKRVVSDTLASGEITLVGTTAAPSGVNIRPH